MTNKNSFTPINATSLNIKVIIEFKQNYHANTFLSILPYWIRLEHFY